MGIDVPVLYSPVPFQNAAISSPEVGVKNVCGSLITLIVMPWRLKHTMSACLVAIKLNSVSV